MIRFRHLLNGCALAVLGGLALPGVAAAQSPYGQSPYGAQPAYPNSYANPYARTFAPPSDADLLAQQLRIVAANPTDLYALLNAAKLSLKVGDTDAAAALYTRASRVNPTNPQVKAGTARLLVQAGRPGEALRRFQDAERYGATLNDFGPDRALAYDLIGEQARAQREYRALLRLGNDDETVRRYALSLGISGLKEPALDLLEPLNRRSDRGAWRARAFVLAMNGDRSGADNIARTMMPPGMAQGLDPFFDRLPRLSATERAFAVSFGETRASPTRLADARLVPQLPALTPEADPFPRRATTQQAAADEGDKRRKKRKPSRKDRELAAQAARQPYVAPLPAPPAPTAMQLAGLSAARSAGYSPYGVAMTMPRGPTVLPPPPEAYRGTVTRAASATVPAPADEDEPDFAVAAVTQVARGAQSSEPAAVVAAAAPRGNPAPYAAPVARNVTSVAGLAPPPVTSVAARPGVASATGAGSSGSPPSPSLGGYTLANSAAPGRVATTNPAAAAPVVANSAPTTLPRLAGAITPNAAGLPPSGQPTAVQAATTPIAPAPGVAASATGSATLAPIGQAPVTQLPVAQAATPLSPVPGTSPTLAPPVSPAPSAAAALTATPAPGTAVAGPPAAITAATGAPPAPSGQAGDAVLAAIIAGIDVPTAERVTRPIATPAAVSGTAPPKLLANIDRKVEAAAAAAPAPAPARVAVDPTLPKKDARGRFVDDRGRPLLDARGRPLGPRAAAAWKADLAAATEPAARNLPKKDARGRFVDGRGRPLLDARGRALDAKAAAAWLSEQADAPGALAGKLPRKDARGRFVDDKGKPLLDARGRALDAKAAAAWQADRADASGAPVGKLPKKDARGRFVDARGKPLLDARGRPLDAKAAAAWQADLADTGPAAARDLPKKDARGRFVDDKGKPLLDARGRPLDAKAAAAWKADAGGADTKKADAGRGEAARIWVQVAGGANEASLNREWARVSGSSAALKGKSGWTTPLRATNRILTGPFKSAAEANALVNRLKKDGVAAFTFSSDDGQKVTRLK